ncbi:unnamed protein product [Oikopleura dioica]|uniref:Uncharacterized protein n=1 Tax=Oikopleura dioica TaxID=34765 RepID=E4YW41_OIKDI|nr:unnamed protein product [Oikopleura dioica]
MAELLVLRLEWSVIHELNVKKHTKRLQQFFETNKPQLTPYSQELLLRHVPEVFEFCPKNATQLVIRLIEMTASLLVTEIFAASLPILERVSSAVMESQSKSERDKLMKMIPLSFLSTEKKLELFNERLDFSPDNLEMTFKVLTHSNSIGEAKSLKAFNLGADFFDAIRKVEKTSETKKYVFDELSNMSAECAYHSASPSEILAAIDDNFGDERIVHSLIKVLRKRLYKKDGNIELQPLINKIFELNPTSRFVTYSDVVMLLIVEYSSGRENVKLSSEQVKRLDLLTKLVTTKMEFSQTQEELGDLSNMLKRIFDILDRCGENNALAVLQKEKHPGNC